MQTFAIEENNSPQHPSIIDTGLAMQLWKERFKARHLCVAQPEKIRHLHRSLYET
jgi:hypothetical protein